MAGHGGNQGRNPNTPEVCPVCGRILKNRLAAVSHYRKHVRANELRERRYGYAEPCEYSADNGRTWWTRGDA